MTSVALAPLGPVPHYGMWGLCFVLLVAARLIDKTPFSKCVRSLPQDGKIIFALLSALTAWTIGVSLLTFTDLHSWGRNVTVPLEMWFGVYLALRTLRTCTARRRFVRLFIAVGAFVLVGNVLRLSGVIQYFPNGSLKQSNSIGGLAMLMFPMFATYAFWTLEDKPAAKLAVITVPSAALLISFSAGAWLGAFAGGLVFLWYALKHRKLTFVFCLTALLALAAVYVGADKASQGRLNKLLLREISQITAFDNASKLTTGRDKIWRASRFMLTERPLTGHGGMEYVTKYRRVYEEHAKDLRLGKMRKVGHPHSTYYYLAYIGGVPAVALFLLAMLFLLDKGIALARAERKAAFPWGVMCIMLIFEILVYGTNGDIFQGRRDISVMVWCLWGVVCALYREDEE